MLVSLQSIFNLAEKLEMWNLENQALNMWEERIKQGEWQVKCYQKQGFLWILTSSIPNGTTRSYVTLLLNTLYFPHVHIRDVPVFLWLLSMRWSQRFWYKCKKIMSFSITTNQKYASICSFINTEPPWKILKSDKSTAKENTVYWRWKQ